uniref:Uncharacterized protein n=1 Tax=Anguilla anguilla TaxID=7936 RepID=A0A0E9R451_ANGAN
MTEMKMNSGHRDDGQDGSQITCASMPGQLGRSARQVDPRRDTIEFQV